MCLSVYKVLLMLQLAIQLIDWEWVVEVSILLVCFSTLTCLPIWISVLWQLWHCGHGKCVNMCVRVQFVPSDPSRPKFILHWFSNILCAGQCPRGANFLISDQLRPSDKIISSAASTCPRLQFLYGHQMLTPRKILMKNSQQKAHHFSRNTKSVLLLINFTYCKECPGGVFEIPCSIKELLQLNEK